MAEGTLDRRVRVGYGLGSVATGTFGTVPGLMLLPYLTDTLGITAAGGRCDRLRAEGMGRGAEPDRRPDQRPLHRPARATASVPAARRARARGLLRADVRRHRLRLHDGGSPVGAGDVRALRDRLRVLPGALRRDAGRDHVVLRRAHPADDAGGWASSRSRSCSAAPRHRRSGTRSAVVAATP